MPHLQVWSGGGCFPASGWAVGIGESRSYQGEKHQLEMEDAFSVLQGMVFLGFFDDFF